MSDRAASLPRELRASFSSAEARSLGVASRRLNHSDLERIAHGLYRRRELGSTFADGNSAQRWRTQQHEMLRDYANHLPEGAFVSGRSAAVFWGLPVPPAQHRLLSIAVFAPRRALRRSGVACSQVRPNFVRVVETRGIRITDPASTWAALGPELSLADLVAVGDAVIREHRIPVSGKLEPRPFATRADLAEMLEQGRRIGLPNLRAALPLLSTRSASAPESHFRLLLSEWGAPDPTLDHDVFDKNGRFLGCSEFAYPALRLAFEYEGDQHRREIQQWNRDIQKYHDYESNGWRVIRITAEMLYRRRSELRALVLDAIASRATR